MNISNSAQSTSFPNSVFTNMKIDQPSSLALLSLANLHLPTMVKSVVQRKEEYALYIYKLLLIDDWGHRVSSSRGEKWGGRHFFSQIEPNWPFP